MSAAEIARVLGGRQCGAGFIVRCPCHDDIQPSLSIRDGDDRLLVKCFAGCDPVDVLRELAARGLLPERDDKPAQVGPVSGGRKSGRTSATLEPDPRALAIWKASGLIADSLAERYLRGRGITIPLPPSLRCHRGLKHGPTGLILPALVAGVQSGDRRLTAIHRTYLRTDGEIKAPVSSVKMALGPIRGGAVRLAAAGASLALTEGIEDALALIQMTGRPAWAVLGTAGFQNFQPPEGVATVILAPDADAAGDGAVEAAVARFASTGLKVVRLRPPDGQDWCDVLTDFEERAAIREYDGGDDRADAELAAFAEIVGGELAGA